jgi:tRNA-specific 2-thiouridylase
LLRNAPQVEQPGPIQDQEGRLVGRHRGLGFYTIGQRKGLGIATPEPLYVTGKNLEGNILIVGKKEALGKCELVAGPVHWVAGSARQQNFKAGVKIRYRAQEAPATIELLEGQQVHVRFDEPLRDITPGQAAVFYDGEICLGGGLIQ